MLDVFCCGIWLLLGFLDVIAFQKFDTAVRSQNGGEEEEEEEAGSLVCFGVDLQLGHTCFKWAGVLTRILLFEQMLFHPDMQWEGHATGVAMPGSK